MNKRHNFLLSLTNHRHSDSTLQTAKAQQNSSPQIADFIPQQPSPSSSTKIAQPAKAWLQSHPSACPTQLLRLIQSPVASPRVGHSGGGSTHPSAGEHRRTRYATPRHATSPCTPAHARPPRGATLQRWHSREGDTASACSREVPSPGSPCPAGLGPVPAMPWAYIHVSPLDIVAAGRRAAGGQQAGLPAAAALPAAP